MADRVPASLLKAHLDQLLTDYHDLQWAAEDRFASPPSALETLRMMHKAHPAVIKGFSPFLSIQKDWSDPKSYVDISGDSLITIAITDDGLADSVRRLPDGSSTFVKPLEEHMTMSTFIDKLLYAPSSNQQQNKPEEILYLQSQDGNVYREPQELKIPELAAFQEVIRRDVPWMKEASGKSADAVNLWIGTKKSITSLHHDPYDNVYTVLSGSKTFTLVSPIEGLWLEQHFHPTSTLSRTETGLRPVPDAGPPIPWVEDVALPTSIRPLLITLNEGDTLFLPSNWWHRVEQSEGPGGLAVAVNYWYPSELRAEHYALERLARRTARAAGWDGVLPVDEENEVPDVWGSDIESGDEWEPSEWGR